MSNGSSFYPQCGTAWLLALGERLRVEYDQTAQPLPPRLIALLAQLGSPPPPPPQTGVRQHGGPVFSSHRQRPGSGGDHVAAAGRGTSVGGGADNQRA